MYARYINGDIVTTTVSKQVMVSAMPVLTSQSLSASVRGCSPPLSLSSPVTPLVTWTTNQTLQDNNLYKDVMEKSNKHF